MVTKNELVSELDKVINLIQLEKHIWTAGESKLDYVVIELNNLKYKIENIEDAEVSE